MSHTLHSWFRRHYQPGGGDALVLFAVFGRFPDPLELDPAHYRSAGLPEGVDAVPYRRPDDDALITALCGDDPLGQELSPELQTAIDQAPMCLLVSGTVSDPETLDYLRDVVGVITCLLDQGGVAVLDWLPSRWYTPEEWRQKVFAPAGPAPRQHISVVVCPEETSAPEASTDGFWVHTRGMRKFGRPDVTIRNVPEPQIDAFVELCYRFTDMLAQGATVPEGQQIVMAGLPEGMSCHPGGTLEDPNFHNLHVEIRHPGTKPKSPAPHPASG